MAWGFPKPLNIPSDLLGDDQITAEAAGSSIPNDARNRVQVPLERRPPWMADGSLPCSSSSTPTGSGHLQRIEPGPSLMKSLLPSFPLAPDRRRMRELFPIAAALSRLPAWTLLPRCRPVTPARRGGNAPRHHRSLEAAPIRDRGSDRGSVVAEDAGASRRGQGATRRSTPTAAARRRRTPASTATSGATSLHPPPPRSASRSPLMP